MLRVLHLTDTHVVATEDMGRPPESFAGAVAVAQGRTTTESLRRVLDAVAIEGFEPDVVLHTGDAADDGEAASYAVLRDELDTLGAPVMVVVPGNHDRADEVATAFGHEPAVVRSTDVGGWRIVTVDTTAFERDHGDLDAHALAALDAALIGSDAPTLIGLHHPPISVCDAASCRLVPAAAVLAIIDAHPQVRAVVSGHLHVSEAIERGGVAYLLSPSTAIQLVHDHPLNRRNRQPTPVGARLLELHDDGRVDTRLIWA